MPSPAKRKPSPYPSYPRAALEALIADAITDAYDDSEQTIGFLTMIQEHLCCPFRTVVLGRTVTVRSIDLDATGQIVALCVTGRHRQPVPICDLPFPAPPPTGAEWIAAYRLWRTNS